MGASQVQSLKESKGIDLSASSFIHDTAFPVKKLGSKITY